MRYAKSLEHKLSDLEDHLFLLVGTINGLNGGETASLRQLAAELRVLICLSSGTDGLLWRLIDEIRVSDAVQAHAVGNVNLNHPLARELRYCFLPLYPPGRGDPRLPIRTYSFRNLIKIYDAVFAAGRGVTHENLIKWIAQEIGSAHAAEEIRDVIAELNAILIAGMQPFFYILRTDALITLDVGERVLQRAGLEGYQRRRPSFTRPGVVNPGPPAALNFPVAAPTVDPAGTDQGTVSFGFYPDPVSWNEAAAIINFPSHKTGRFLVETTKTLTGFWS